MTTDSIAARDRSYAAERAVPAGSTASFAVDISRNIPSQNFTVWTPVTIPAGADVRIVGYSNAGFRGIEATVLYDGRYVHGISAGLLNF